MTYARDDFETSPCVPSWVTSGRREALEDVAFLSGAALSHLHLVVCRSDVPQTLFRERLALRAEETCVEHCERPERARDLHDIEAFLQPCAQPGPAQEIYQTWRKVVAPRNYRRSPLGFANGGGRADRNMVGGKAGKPC